MLSSFFLTCFNSSLTVLDHFSSIRFHCLTQLAQCSFAPWALRSSWTTTLRVKQSCTSVPATPACPWILFQAAWCDSVPVFILLLAPVWEQNHKQGGKLLIFQNYHGNRVVLQHTKNPNRTKLTHKKLPLSKVSGRINWTSNMEATFHLKKRICWTHLT